MIRRRRAGRCGVVGIYQRHDWADEKRAALDAWSAHLLAAAEGRLTAAKSRARSGDRLVDSCKEIRSAVHRGPEVSRRKASPILHRGVIPKRGYVAQRSGVPPSPKSSFAAFWGKGHEVIFEFHASPLPGGFHHGGVSLWPCSSRRQVTRHRRQPGGANASVGGSRAHSFGFESGIPSAV